LTGQSIRVSLMGAWRLTVDGEPVHLRSREQRLVAMLALRQFPSRSTLAEALWPDSTRRQSLGSLRAAVFNLRAEAPGVLADQPETLMLSDRVTCDVEELVRHSESARTAEAGDSTEQVISALDVPDLLTGWYDAWVEEERDRLRNLRLEALIAITENCIDSHRYGLAQAAAAAAVVVDPTNEECCELLVRTHLALGERLDAVQEFERFRERLLDEIGTEPARHLSELAYGKRSHPRERLAAPVRGRQQLSHRFRDPTRRG
jgi:DNA-binding SARP family transcriptional activator